MRAAGPLGRYITHYVNQGGDHLNVMFGDNHATNPNALTLLRGVAWVSDHEQDDVKKAESKLRDLISNKAHPHHLLEAANRRRETAVRQLVARGAMVKVFEANAVDQMVVGLGDETPREYGLRLHGTYGAPILPGQSIKGAAAQVAREDDANKEGVTPVFGGPERGWVAFLDALPRPLPAKTRPLTTDVLTPHGEEWEQPVPVPFLAVGSSQKFVVYLVASGPDAEALLDLYAGDWLTEALIDGGLGAKTSSGYGYMHVTDQAFE